MCLLRMSKHVDRGPVVLLCSRLQYKEAVRTGQTSSKEVLSHNVLKWLNNPLVSRTFAILSTRQKENEEIWIRGLHIS